MHSLWIVARGERRRPESVQVAREHLPGERVLGSRRAITTINNTNRRTRYSEHRRPAATSGSTAAIVLSTWMDPPQRGGKRPWDRAERNAAGCGIGAERMAHTRRHGWLAGWGRTELQADSPFVSWCTCRTSRAGGRTGA